MRPHSAKRQAGFKRWVTLVLVVLAPIIGITAWQGFGTRFRDFQFERTVVLVGKNVLEEKFSKKHLSNVLALVERHVPVGHRRRTSRRVNVVLHDGMNCPRGQEILYQRA